jgi:hypothetical protein
MLLRRCAVKEKIIERLLGVATSLIIFLVYSFVSSFASKAELNMLEAKVDKVLSGLCIIDNRTCKLIEHTKRE